jgi:Holliday junction DNA helicase RuvA
MYDFIEGTVVEKSPAQIVVRAGDIGYRLTVPLTTVDSLPPDGKVRLFTSLHIREDRIEIFGFLTNREREMFLLLNSVQGLGPKMAIKILSGMSPAAFVTAVTEGRTGELKRVRGIGPKVAGRIVLELKDSVTRLGAGTAGASAGGDQTMSDAIVALVKLGFTGTEAKKAVRSACVSLGDGASCEDLIRKALE